MVTVGTLLQSRPETLGLDLEILAGSGGLNRRILSPDTQKTGLALGEVIFEAERCELPVLRTLVPTPVDGSEIDELSDPGDDQ